MQPTPEKRDRAPPQYIDVQSGQRYYNLQQAARLVEGVTRPTLERWAKGRVTSFGLELDVREEPITKHRHCNKKNRPVTPRERRFLLREDQVLAIKEILHAVGREKPSLATTDSERGAMRLATWRYRQKAKGLSH